MLEDFQNCECQKSETIENHKILEEFAEVRKTCPALKKILVPDKSWDKFKLTATDELDEALHNYVVLEAFRCGCLNKITSPIHRFLLDKGILKIKLENQYGKDLVEHWILEKDLIERHRKFRCYYGKLVELLIAEFLVDINWTISDLAVLGAKRDIIAISPNKIKYFIEVKYIGQKDEDFLAVVDSIKGKGDCGFMDIHLAANYLIYIVYTAAKQFEKNFVNSIAIILLSNMNWNFLDLPITENWINWESPRFFDYSIEWRKLLVKIKKEYPSIEEELKTTINSLSELWIIKEDNFFELSLQQTVKFNINT